MTVRHRLINYFAVLVVIGTISFIVTYIQVVKPPLGLLIKPFIQPVSLPQITNSPAKTAGDQSKNTQLPKLGKATTTQYVNVRSGKSANTDLVMNLDPGTEVELAEDSDRTWQQVSHNGKKGYIYKAYLQY